MTPHEETRADTNQSVLTRILASRALLSAREVSKWVRSDRLDASRPGHARMSGCEKT